MWIFFSTWKFWKSSQNTTMLMCFFCIAMLLTEPLVWSKRLFFFSLSLKWYEWVMARPGCGSCATLRKHKVFSFTVALVGLAGSFRRIQSRNCKWRRSQMEMKWRRLLLLRPWVRGSAERANWGIFCCVLNPIGCSAFLLLQGWLAVHQIVSSMRAGTMFCVSLYDSLCLVRGWQMCGMLNIQ